ncbi:hypothetical protein HYU13_06090 [Candidatus Woesearchaeota archaeon]|nr:hypothetical protein [Candidatus Woesearchaeota archaeon]
MPESLETVTEASVQVNSGRLIVARADALSHLDWVGLIEKMNISYLTGESKVMKRSFDADDKAIDAVSRLLGAYEKNDPHVKRFAAESQTATQQKDRWRDENKFKPPKLLPGANYVMAPKNAHDGYFPIVKSGLDYLLLFDVKVPRIGREPDVSHPDAWTRHGSLIGFQASDFPLIVVADADSFRLGEGVNPQYYNIIRTPPGDYACKFAKNPFALSIGRKWDLPGSGNSK